MVPLYTRESQRARGGLQAPRYTFNIYTFPSLPKHNALRVSPLVAARPRLRVAVDARERARQRGRPAVHGAPLRGARVRALRLLRQGAHPPLSTAVRNRLVSLEPFCSLSRGCAHTRDSPVRRGARRAARRRSWVVGTRTTRSHSPGLSTTSGARLSPWATARSSSSSPTPTGA